jgi:hypothetical protein
MAFRGIYLAAAPGAYHPALVNMAARPAHNSGISAHPAHCCPPLLWCVHLSWHFFLFVGNDPKSGTEIGSFPPSILCAVFSGDLFRVLGAVRFICGWAFHSEDLRGGPFGTLPTKLLASDPNQEYSPVLILLAFLHTRALGRAVSPGGSESPASCGPQDYVRLLQAIPARNG